MVNERAPSQTSAAPSAPAARPSPNPPQATTNQLSRAPVAPAVQKPLQPKFGEASPLRNPHAANNVFNANQRRPEHHRPSPPSGSKGLFIPNNRPFKPPGPAPSASRNGDPAPVARQGFYLPGQKRQEVQKPNPYASIGADFFEISKPSNPAYKSIQPAPKPTFSSLGPRTVYQPFAPPARQTIDLTKDDDGFDPDAAVKDNAFGAADPYMYIDPSKANEDIKGLLEGAFDDDDDKPKHRLRRRAKKDKDAKQVIEVKTKSLAEKLADLEVKDEKTSDAKDKEEKQEGEEDEDEDEEDGTVEGLNVKLLPHQVEGVSWMIVKEIGERKKKGILPKGGILADDMGLGKTIQSVALILTNPRPAKEAQPDHPTQLLPGSEVGKGTLVIAPLALIKQWEAEIKSKVERSHALRVLVHHGSSRTKSHLELKKYDVVITTYQILASEHAGSSERPDGPKVGCYGVHWYRVILDEAHSIKNRNAKSTQACYALRSFYRWCLTGTPMQNNLDELQSLICFLQIKPYCDLSRWKDQITGPMKSGNGHYAIKRVQYFLKGCMKRRTKDILKKEGALNFGGEAKDGEKKSAGMKIVDRKVDTVVCELDAGEREFYDRLAERANDRLKDMMAGEKTDYIGALVLLLRLRQACNHPQLIESAMKKDKDALATAGLGGNQSPRKGSAADGDVDDLADMLGGLGVATKNCDVCQIELTSAEISKAAVRCADCENDLADQKRRGKHHKTKKASTKPKPVKAVTSRRNNRVIHDSDDEEEADGDWVVPTSQQVTLNLGKAGGTDDEDAEGVGRSLGSIDSETGDEDSEDDMRARTKREPTDPTSVDDLSSDTDSDSLSDSGVPEISSHSSNMPRASTKIRRLLRILHADTPTHKVIVFSQFTTMLDLIEPHLKRASIRYVRYDGSMRNDAREASLESLRNDQKTRVLLCSLKCGSLGLNLTVASRVVIVEPFWNPFVEEQAIDRVHRLNQTRNVRVYKLTVANTVEERIMELQDKKRQLANAAIEGGKAVAKLNMKDLLGLFGSNPETVGPPGEDSVKWTAPESGGILRANVGGVKAVAVVGGAADQRRRVASGPKGRQRVEDPVYGRR